MDFGARFGIYDPNAERLDLSLVGRVLETAGVDEPETIALVNASSVDGDYFV